MTGNQYHRQTAPTYPSSPAVITHILFYPNGGAEILKSLLQHQFWILIDLYYPNVGGGQSPPKPPRAFRLWSEGCHICMSRYDHESPWF